MRWQLPSLGVMKLEVQELVLPPPRFPLSLCLLLSPHVPTTLPLCPSRYQHPYLQEELTSPSGKLPCSSLLFQQELQAVEGCARGSNIGMGAHGAAGVTCGDSASVQTPLMLAGCVDAGSRGWVLEWQKVTHNKFLGCSGSASSSSPKCPSSHPSQEASGAACLSARTPSGRVAVGSGAGGCLLRSSSSLFLFRSFSCSSSCQKILRSEHGRSH